VLADAGFASPLTVKHAWSARFGNAGYPESRPGLTVDTSGKSYIVGSFGGTIDFGGGTLSSAGGLDVFLACFTPEGKQLWSKSLGGTGNDWGQAVAVDRSGNVYVTGRFEGKVDFGGGELTSGGSGDIFLVSLTSKGGHRWSKRFGSGTSDALALDHAGTVFLVGTARGGALDFGGGPLAPVSKPGGDVVIASFSSTGSHLWSKRLGGIGLGGSANGRGVAVDGLGGVYVTGTFFATVDFGGGPVAGQSPYYGNGFLLSLSGAGSYRWATALTGFPSSQGWAVAAGQCGNVFVAGLSSAPPDFGVEPQAVFVAGFAPDGQQRWLSEFRGAAGTAGTSVVLDPNETVYFAGFFSNVVGIGSGALQSAGGQDIVLASLTSDGHPRWSRRFGGSSDDQASGAAIDGSGNLYLTGSIHAGADFGGGPLHVSGQQTAPFLAKFVP